MSTASFAFALFYLFVVFSTTNHQILDRCKSYWAEANKYNSGNITVADFARVVRNVTDMSDQHIAEVFLGLDTDNDSLLSYEELCDMFKEPTCLQRKGRLTVTFHNTDKDKSGFLNMAEVRSAYVKLGYDLSNATFNEFYSADQDGNGLISLDEFFTQFEVKC